MYKHIVAHNMQYNHIIMALLFKPNMQEFGKVHSKRYSNDNSFDIRHFCVKIVLFSKTNICNKRKSIKHDETKVYNNEAVHQIHKIGHNWQKTKQSNNKILERTVADLTHLTKEIQGRNRVSNFSSNLFIKLGTPSSIPEKQTKNKTNKQTKSETGKKKK